MRGADTLRARARRLIATANDLLAIANDLESLAESRANLSVRETPTLARPVMLEQPHWLEVAKRAYKDRRRREKFFDPVLFGEPAWDMLLDLFIAAKSDKKVSVTSACIAAAVPATTALRWIAVLESQGLVSRASDPDDARRAFLNLTDAGYRHLTDYFAAQM